MNASDMIIPTLASLLVQSPILLVWLVGFILAAVYWRWYPRVSLLTVIALTIFLIDTIVSSFLNLWLPLLLSDGGMATSRIGQIFFVKNVITAIINAIAWGLLIAAIFSGRKTTDEHAREAPIQSLAS